MMIEGKARKGRGRPIKNEEKIIRAGPSSQHSTVMILSSFFYVNEIMQRGGRKPGSFTIYDTCEKFSSIDYCFHSLEQDLINHYPRFASHRSVLPMLRNMCGIGKKDVFWELITMFDGYMKKVLEEHPDPMGQFLHGSTLDTSYPYLRFTLDKRLEYGIQCDDIDHKLQELWQPYVSILLESFRSEWEGKQNNKYYAWIVRDDQSGNNRKLRDIWVQCNKNNPVIEVHDKQIQANSFKDQISHCSAVVTCQIKPQYYHEQKQTTEAKRENPLLESQDKKAIEEELGEKIKKKPMIGFQQQEN